MPELTNGSGNSKKFTIFMYPWFAMGHLIPYIQTANKLAERGHKIFVITPPKARSKLDPLNLYPNLINYKPISIPPVDGLPENVQTTNDASTVEEKQLLRHALDLTQPVIQSLLCDMRPDFVFFDFMHWLPALARALRIKSVHYSLVSPAAVSFLFADQASSADEFPQSIKLSKHAASGLKFFETVKELGSGITVKQRLISAICDSDAIVFRSCTEIEGVDYCKFLENKLGKPIILAGPVVLKPQRSTDLDRRWTNWLDKFGRKTVIFCAFGSEAVLKREQFEKLLAGIEKTGYPFLIALRPPSGVDVIEEALPEGFKERVQERGIVNGGWVPQQLILKHPAVGCFVTHCGYGSMWEGLTSECGLVALPHVGDQYIDAKVLSEVVKVGIEVERGGEDGGFTEEGVKGAIMEVMGEESEIGKEVRGNHGKLREVLLSEGFEESYFDGFVEKLHNFLELSS